MEAIIATLLREDELGGRRADRGFPGFGSPPKAARRQRGFSALSRDHTLVGELLLIGLEQLFAFLAELPQMVQV